MKKSLLFSLAMVFSIMAFAQSNVVKLNILSAAIRTANVQYERALNESSSLQLGFYFTGAQTDGTTLRGYGITPEYRMYFGDNSAPNGFFVAPFARYVSWTLKDEIDGQVNEGKLTRFGGGLVVGRQWIFSDIVTFEAFLGPKYTSNSIEVVSGEDTFDGGFIGGGFGIRGGITFGVTF